MYFLMSISPWGTSVPLGGRNFRLMALCHGGALQHSKNNAMFIKHLNPGRKESARARFFTTIFLKNLLLNIVY